MTPEGQGASSSTPLAEHEGAQRPGPSPATVAAGAGLAEVVAGTADTVAVSRSGDADVVAALADAAVAPRALRVAGVALAVADELVGAVAEVGDERDRQAIEHLHHVTRRTHVERDRGDSPQRADGLHAPHEVTPGGMSVSHGPLDDNMLSLDAQLQVRAGGGTVDDDVLGGGGGGWSSPQQRRRLDSGREKRQCADHSPADRHSGGMLE